MPMGVSERGFIPCAGSPGRNVETPLVVTKTFVDTDNKEETTEKISTVILRLKKSVRGWNGCSGLWFTVIFDQGIASPEMEDDERRATTA